MPLYRNSDRIVLFVHIPKTGGSTVEEVLKAEGSAQALKYHKRLGYSKSTPQHMHWDITKHWISEEFYDYAFTVVRNPFARLLSEYRWRQKMTQSPLPAFDPWVVKTLAADSERPYQMDNHIRPQVAFIGPNVEVFRLEDGLMPAVKNGLEALGLPSGHVTLHHKRKSDHQPVEVTASTIEKIRHFYAEDFDTFGYSPDELPALYKKVTWASNLFRFGK